MALKPENQALAKVLIQGILLFGGTTPPQVDALTAGLDLLDIKKGKVIIMEQEISKTLYLLAKGSVGIWRREKGEKKLVATLKAPDFFGETSMFTESAATALVKAEEDCQFYLLKRANFDAVLAQFPDLGPLVQKHIEEIKAARPPVIKPKPEGDES